ncbi:MAG: acyl-CoA dehydrogenase [Sphingomonadaceae bacterium]|nr:acyl-CoA dehydrogenase [Sphingomonadaceae bacterium]
MDFEDTPEEAAYRAKVRAWIEANKDALPDRDHGSRAESVAAAKKWQARKYEAGYVGITWPKAVGGQGGSAMQQIIFNQEEAKYNAPTGLYAIGLGMCIPTVFSHALSPEIAQRYVPVAMKGEEVWCQLFSEPAAGSDLAGIRTRAERDGDDWVINGQKVWTSGAHLSDFGIVVTRTDPNVPKHKGLTMFIVDMKAPGVEVRPIKQMSGGSEFNEVFFTDVRIKDTHRLGEVGEGWKVSLTTLMHERLAVGGKPASAPGVKEMIELAKAIDFAEGSALEQSHVRISALSSGRTPGPESSISKIVIANNMQDMGAFAADLCESAGLMMGDDAPDLPHLTRFQTSYIGSAGLRIAGGTDEILRNIIAERVLGLPGEIRPDKDIPFSEATKLGL